MIIPTDGTHIECPTCRGNGMVLHLKRAMMSSNPSINTLSTAYSCRACEGTGWLPPKPRTEPPPMDFSDLDDDGDAG
jgi:DnaJ-class molecular chaperone